MSPAIPSQAPGGGGAGDARIRPPPSFSVGVCAADRMDDPVGFVRSILEESARSPAIMRELVIVASGVQGPTLSRLEQASELDERVKLLVEPKRRGKAEAINRILSSTSGEYILFVNADATPEPGAMASLLELVSSSPRNGAVSALPVPEASGGVASLLARFMWSAHNECSVYLNHLGVANHSSDELVVFRVSATTPLPAGLVNDGAYMAGVAKRRGYKVKVCQSAKVRVRTPSRLVEVILQRRRILFGHAQVWREVGAPPMTIESMLVLSPFASMRLLARSLSNDSRFLLVLPLAGVGEALAAALSIIDTLRSTTAHEVWRRFT
ncbi:MAG: glycosyltransferase [Nitrososphaerota archaeon]|nr:glycosyltransferase [Nitrososphaerota archaeon]MDG7026356.1 glycosyltransferase [Nitrososphaerota archaeon]